LPVPDFFHFMVEMFIKHVLGVNQDHSGLYGKTSAYYATVEQQGRLTLHLHMLLWILNHYLHKKLEIEL
jgi:Helitron helicase-like domain at N-terminus